MTAPLPHATDFLTAGCRTHLYAGLDSARRAECRALMHARGYTHFYLYAYNESDYGGPDFDSYAAPARFRELLAELNDAGLEPVVWLVPDDAPQLAAMPADTIMAMFDRLVPLIDGLVSSFVLGLELDEYWSASRVDSLGSRLADLTGKPIAVHQTSGKWEYCKFAWCDYMILQYGFDLQPEAIGAMTRAAIADLGKPVVAGEYEFANEARAVRLGDQGVAAGAAGFGNGGTTAQTIQRRAPGGESPGP